MAMSAKHCNIDAGGEARYLRQYDGPGLDSLAGEGLFLGPTVYVKLSRSTWIAALERAGRRPHHRHRGIA
jgi:hypothetical protein